MTQKEIDLRWDGEYLITTVVPDRTMDIKPVARPSITHLPRKQLVEKLTDKQRIARNAVKFLADAKDRADRGAELFFEWKDGRREPVKFIERN